MWGSTNSVLDIPEFKVPAGSGSAEEPLEPQTWDSLANSFELFCKIQTPLPFPGKLNQQINWKLRNNIDLS